MQLLKKMETKKDKIALFFNSERGISVYKSLRKNYSLDIFLSKKNLKRKVKTILKKKKDEPNNPIGKFVK